MSDSRGVIVIDGGSLEERRLSNFLAQRNIIVITLPKDTPLVVEESILFSFE